MRQKMRFRILSFVMAIVMIFGILGYGGSKVQVLAGAAVSINEVTVIPQGAKGFFIDDLGTANSSAVSKYSAYAQGNVTAQGDFMKYTAGSENDSNGIKLNVTSYIKKGTSGTVYGASLMMGVAGWAGNAPASMFFEVISTGGSVETYELTTVDPTGNTISNPASGALWYNKLVTGESPVYFEEGDSVYLCVKQKGTTQCYDEVALWGYVDQHVGAADVVVTTPMLNDAQDRVEFEVTNLTEVDRNLVISITNYDASGSISGIDEYNLALISGIEEQAISLVAKRGSVLQVADATGKVYFESYKLGSYDWVSTWATAEEKANIDANSMPQMSLAGTTYRQIARVTTSGTQLRFRFSNQYGEGDVVMDSVRVAKQITATKSDIDTSTDTLVTFNGGEESVVIPKGEVIISDPIEFPVEALDRIAISSYFSEVPTTITSHRGARATQYQMRGNHVSSKSLDFASTTKSWYYLCDISILSPEGSGAVVCFGDSITDGFGTDNYYGATPDRYVRWGDFFAERLQENETTKKVSVLNEGIGSNSILGSYPTDAGKDRFARDLLEHDGVKYCIIYFGTNDIGEATSTSKLDQLLVEYKKMIDLCKENDITVYAIPITQFKGGSYYTESSESMRQSINAFLRSEEAGINGIIDFESALADPEDSNKISDDYTYDFLHPSKGDGYRVMADAIDLSLFE